MRDSQLYIYAERGDSGMVSFLLANKEDVNKKGSQGNTPLHISVIHGHIKIVRSLLANIADANMKNNTGETPLHLSAQYGHTKISLVLLDRGAYVNVQNVNGETPLHLSAQFGHADVVSVLLDKGADVNVKNNADDNPFHVSVAYRRPEIVSQLLEHKADVNVKRRNGDTALHMSVQYGEVRIVSLLLKNKADVNISNEMGYTPLHVSAESGDFDIVSMLLEKHADLHAKCHRGFTPLNYAARSNHWRVAHYLRQHDSGGHKSTLKVPEYFKIKKHRARYDVTSRNSATAIPDEAENKEPCKLLKLKTVEIQPDISMMCAEKTYRKINSGFKIRSKQDIRHNSSDSGNGNRSNSHCLRLGDGSMNIFGKHIQMKSSVASSQDIGSEPIDPFPYSSNSRTKEHKNNGVLIAANVENPLAMGIGTESMQREMPMSVDKTEDIPLKIKHSTEIKNEEGQIENTFSPQDITETVLRGKNRFIDVKAEDNKTDSLRENMKRGKVLSTNDIVEDNKAETILEKPLTLPSVAIITAPTTITKLEDATSNAVSYKLHLSTNTGVMNVPGLTTDDRSERVSDQTSAVENDDMLKPVIACQHSGEISVLEEDQRLKTSSPAKHKEDTVAKSQKQVKNISDISLKVSKTEQYGNTFVNIIIKKTVERNIVIRKPFGVTIGSGKYVVIGGSIEVGSRLSDTSSDTSGTGDGSDDTESSNENIDVAVADTDDRQEIQNNDRR